MCYRPLPVILLFTVFIIGCASDPDTALIEDSQNLLTCPEVRPQICTMEYAPVCGVTQDNQSETFANGCGACSHPDVIGYKPGECQG